MQSTNVNFKTFGASTVRYVRPVRDYLELENTTISPNAPVKVYKIPEEFQAAFNQNMLNPHQNDPSILSRAYYTIDKAYGPPPTATQQTRACTADF